MRIGSVRLTRKSVRAENLRSVNELLLVRYNLRVGRLSPAAMRGPEE